MELNFETMADEMILNDEFLDYQRHMQQDVNETTSINHSFR